MYTAWGDYRVLERFDQGDQSYRFYHKVPSFVSRYTLKEQTKSVQSLPDCVQSCTNKLDCVGLTHDNAKQTNNCVLYYSAQPKGKYQKIPSDFYIKASHGGNKAQMELKGNSEKVCADACDLHSACVGYNTENGFCKTYDRTTSIDHMIGVIDRLCTPKDISKFKNVCTGVLPNVACQNRLVSLMKAIDVVSHQRISNADELKEIKDLYQSLKKEVIPSDECTSETLYLLSALEDVVKDKEVRYRVNQSR